ncbi:MAG: hypothetical protein GX802_00395 [Clostridiales bacterium]|nr:hypothetical protein [Clostridiales bacterium]
MKRVRIFALVLCFAFVLGLVGGCNKDEYADAEGKYLKPKKLSAKLEKQIIEDFDKTFKSPWQNLRHDNFETFYYGVYNDAVALLILPTNSGAEYQHWVNIAEYSYQVFVQDAAIYLYKDGTFTVGNEAYEKGIITKQDAETIVWLFNNQDVWIPEPTYN